MDGQATIEVFDLTSRNTEVIADKLQILSAVAPFGIDSSPNTGILSSLAWSPDEARIAFVGGKGMFPNGASIYLFESTTGDVYEITSSEVWADSPVWLDDTYLVFRSREWAKGAELNYAHERNIYEAQNLSIVNVDNKKTVKLTKITAPSSSFISCPFLISQSVCSQIVTTQTLLQPGL